MDDSVYSAYPFKISVNLVSATESKLGTNTTTILVQDNGDAGFIAFEATKTTIIEDAGSLVVKLQRTNGTYGNVTAFITSSISSALWESPIGTVVLFGNGVTTATINVTIRNSDDFENRKFTLRLSNPTGGSSLSNEPMTVAVADKGDVSFAGSPRVALQNVSGGMISVNWDPPAYSGGEYGVVLDYHVLLLTDDGFVLASNATNSTSIQYFDLSNETAYIIKVAGINKRGIGEYSEALRLVTTAPVEPGPTPRFVIANVTGGMFDLFWSYPLDKGGLPIAFFRISVLCQTTNASRFIEVTNTSMKASVGDLNSNTLYNVSITTVNEALLEGPLVTNSTITLSGTTPAQPPKPSLMIATGGALYLNVFTPVDCGGADLVSYTVYYTRYTGWLINYQIYATINITNKLEDGSVGVVSVYGLMSRSKYLFKISIANILVRSI